MIFSHFLILVILLPSTALSSVSWTITDEKKVTDNQTATEFILGLDDDTQSTSEKRERAESRAKKESASIKNQKEEALQEDGNENAQIKINDLINLIEESPEIIEAKEAIGLSDWEIGKIEAQNGPQVDVKSSGGYQILSNLPRDHRRFNDENLFIDTTITLDKKVFDSGLSQSRINAEKKRRERKILIFNGVKRDLFGEALSIGYTTLEALAISESLDVSLNKLKMSRKDEEKRFLSGTGTSSNIKEIDLLAIDLINEKQLKTFEIELQKTTFKKRFGGELGNFLQSISTTKIPVHENESIDFINKIEALKIFDLEIDALNSEILARKRANKPSLNMNLSANFYDIENRIANNHEVTGGLNLSIPMFDSGLVKNEVRSLLAQINIQKNNRIRKSKEFNLQFQELKNKMSKIRQEKNTLDLKIENLSQKLEQLKLRSSSLEANGLEIAKIENRLASFFRTSMSLGWAAKKIELEKSVLFETILNGLQPVGISNAN